MKLRDRETGRVWEIGYIQTVDEFGTTRRFYGGYDLLVDLEGSVTSFRKQIDTSEKATPATCPHTETQIAELSKTVSALSKTMSTLFESFARNSIRIETLESENQRLKDRLNAIEGLGIPR